MYITNHHYYVNNNIRKASLALSFSNCKSRAELSVFVANYSFFWCKRPEAEKHIHAKLQI